MLHAQAAECLAMAYNIGKSQACKDPKCMIGRHLGKEKDSHEEKIGAA